MGLPYRLVLTVACVVFAGRYLFYPDRRSYRWIVALATVASFILPDGLGWYIVGVILQLTISLFVALRLTYLEPKKRVGPPSKYQPL